MVFAASTPASPRSGLSRVRLPEKGLMDPYPILQSLRTGPDVLDRRDDPPSLGRLEEADVRDGHPPSTVPKSDVHDWERQLQENRSRARAMSVASNRTDATAILEDLELSPVRPSLYDRTMHVPTRTRWGLTLQAPMRAVVAQRR